MEITQPYTIYQWNSETNSWVQLGNTSIKRQEMKVIFRSSPAMVNVAIGSPQGVNSQLRGGGHAVSTSGMLAFPEQTREHYPQPRGNTDEAGRIPSGTATPLLGSPGVVLFKLKERVLLTSTTGIQAQTPGLSEATSYLVQQN